MYSSFTGTTNNSIHEGLTPASIIPAITVASSGTNIEVPKARGVYERVDLEAVEREKGNAEFKVGNFASAVKYYTKCLGLKVNRLNLCILNSLHLTDQCIGK